jgi:hypothetical protein
MVKKQPQMSSKNAALFQVQNGAWIVTETEPGVYELSTADGSQKISGLSAKACMAGQGVFAELERHINDKGGA